MKFSIFVWLVLALLAAGVAARTHSLASNFTAVNFKDPRFLPLDQKIRETNGDLEFIKPTSLKRSGSTPTVWSVGYQTHRGIVMFAAQEKPNGEYTIMRQ